MSFNFMAAVTICSDFEPKQIKSDTVSTVSPSIFHEVMGPDAYISLVIPKSGNGFVKIQGLHGYYKRNADILGV